MEDEQQAFLRLSVALAIGLLIGAELGWKEREARVFDVNYFFRPTTIRSSGLVASLRES
ncbi:MAG: hypothetical protein ACREX9_21775 [Gammaproteobacteria bacterium]